MSEVQRLTDVTGQAQVDFTDGIDHMQCRENRVFQLRLSYHVGLQPLLSPILVQPAHPIVFVPIMLYEVGGQTGMIWATVIREPKRVSVPAMMPWRIWL